jgi:arylsulfatase A-like enzyme
MGSEALEFLAGTPGGQPFCLSISFNAPHARDGKPREFQPDDRDEALYGGVEFPVPRTATDALFQLLPPSVKRSISRTRWALRFDTPEKYQSTLRDYFRLVTGLDREVGRIREALSKRGLAENTLILFTSDNGFFLGERGLADKWYLYEESVRAPLVIFDPRLPAARRGGVCSAMTLNLDLAPTLLDLAGLESPKVMQGRSLVPFLAGSGPPGDWRSEFYYEHVSVRDKIAASEGLRTERWTYFQWLDEHPVVEELYDTANDPLQERNLIADPEQAATLAGLRTRLAVLREEAR